MLGASIWMPRWGPPEPPDLAWVDLPEEIGGWEAVETLAPDGGFLGSVHLQRQRQRRYRRGDETVSIFVGYEDRLSRSRSLLSPKNAFPGRGWEAEECAPVDLGSDGFQGVGVVARSQTRRVLSYYWYQGAGGVETEVLRAWLGTDRSCLRRPTGLLVVRIDTEISSAAEGRARAEAELHELAALLISHFSGVGAAAGAG